MKSDYHEYAAPKSVDRQDFRNNSVHASEC